MKNNINQKNIGAVKALGLSFIIATLAILPILISNDWNLYLVGDYMTQQLPFLKESRRMFLSGSPFWSNNTFLGANFLGSYSFYVYGSPFFYPLLLIPENYLGVGVAAMFALKHAVAALSAYLYLHKHLKSNGFAVVGALLYAFSSFSLDSTYYYHFLDVIALFPLVLYSIDEVLENRGKLLLPVFVFLNAVTNYYFFVSTSIFVLIYVLFKIIYSEKYKLKDAFRCFFFYLLGVCAAAIIIIPSALTLLETSKATDSFNNILVSALSTIPQCIKTLKGVVLPSEGILGSGTGFLFSQFCSNSAFVPFFGAVFLVASLKENKKTWDNRLLKFLCILSVVPFGNGLFSLFTNMNYTRWWYAFVLIVVAVTLKNVEYFSAHRDTAFDVYKQSIKAVAKIAISVTVPLIALKIICAYFLNDFIQNNVPKSLQQYLYSSGLANGFTVTDFKYLAVLLFLTAISYATLHIAMKKEWVYDCRKVVAAVSIICTLSYSVYLCNECGLTEKRNANQIAELSSSVVNQSTEYSSRMAFDKRLANYSMVVNQPSISTFNSFKSHATSEFCRIVGYEIGKMPATKAYYSTPAIQTVLGVSHKVNSDFVKEKAPYYSGFGYEYNYYVPDVYEFTKNKDENNKRIELMTAACVLDNETATELSDLLKPFNEQNFDWKKSAEKARKTSCSEFVMDSTGFSASTTSDHRRIIYFSIPHDNGWTAKINNEETKIYTLNGGMMGIIVPEGTAEIEFTFNPPGLNSGIVISLISVFIFIVYGVYSALRKRHYRL